MAIQNYHAHIYFSPGEETDRARALCAAVDEHFGERIKVGGFHEKPVGPHPRGSCQITVQPGDFEAVVSWLAMHRNGVTVFCHLSTGDHLADHTDHVVWLGNSEALKLDIFRS